MSDPAEVIEKEDKETEVVEKKDETTNKQVVEAIQEVKKALTTKENPQPTREEIREALKAKSGFTDAQLDIMEQMNGAAVNANSQKVAELQEKVAWNDFKDEVGGKIDPAVEKLMKEELKQYDVSVRGDKVLIKKVYYLAKGIIADKAEKIKKTETNDKPNNSDKIEGRQIVETTSPGSTKSLENDGKKTSGGAALSDDEKTIARKMGISEDDYANSKKSKIVGDHKPKPVFRGA